MLTKFNKGSCVSCRILTLAAVLTCDLQAFAQNSNTGAISGGVLNMDRDTPLAGVGIRVTNLSTGFAKGVSTGKNGAYYVAYLHPDRYRIEAILQDYEYADPAGPYEVTVNITNTRQIKMPPFRLRKKSAATQVASSTQPS